MRIVLYMETNTSRPDRLSTVADFKREVQRQLRTRFGVRGAKWDWAKRGAFPTGVPCITGEGVLPSGQRFLAVYTAPRGQRHTLEVREVA